MQTEQLLKQLNDQPQTVEFNDVIDVIDAHYHFEPTAFTNGDLNNKAGENNGSCKIFSFAVSHQLDAQQTLHCFGSYYRQDVLDDPDGSSHQNIRNFIRSGWQGITFDGNALTSKD